MPIVLVHGSPETAAVWDLLAPRLEAAGHETPLRLSPPGFGAAVPAGFGATVADYRGWLTRELERLGEPVDLVGHDWGGGHVLNVAMTRPDLLRSWCTDVPGVFDPGYVWHDVAQRLQTAGEGERWVAEQLARSPGERAAGMLAQGADPAVATRVGAGFTAEMGGCILRLYRSARQPVMAELGAGLEAAAARPGLVLLASEDHVTGTDEQRRRAAARTGAEVRELPGLGHWWMTQDEGRAGAAALTGFWAALR